MITIRAPSMRIRTNPNLRRNFSRTSQPAELCARLRDARFRRGQLCFRSIASRHRRKTPSYKTMSTTKKKWSAEVTEHSDAIDLKKNVFKQSDPKAIARSVKESATRSKRRKAPPKRSAMSMLSFYLNRAGKNLSAAQKKKLERAKQELRKLPE